MPDTDDNTSGSKRPQRWWMAFPPDPRSPRTLLRDMAWEIGRLQEPQRRQQTFALVHERLRYGAAADCTADELIALVYREESPDAYWTRALDTPLRERTGIGIECFLAVHAASEPGAPSLTRCQAIMKLPSIQAKLASEKGGPAREAVRELADDPDYGALIVIPPLRQALGLEATEAETEAEAIEAPDPVEAAAPPAEVVPGPVETVEPDSIAAATEDTAASSEMGGPLTSEPATPAEPTTATTLPKPARRARADAAELKRRRDSQGKFTAQQQKAALKAFNSNYKGLPGRDNRWQAYRRDVYDTGRGRWLSRASFG